MKLYLAILKVRIATLFQYRAAALAGLSTQVFWGIVKTMIMVAFYSQATSSASMTLQQAITFIWLGQALLQLLPWNIDKEIEAQVKNGDVAYELIRPLDLYWLWFYRSLAMRLVPTFLRCIPIFLLAGLFFDLSMPVSLNAGISFSISVIFSALVSTAMTTLITLTLFWTISGEGLMRLIPHLTMLLSGMVVPLPLFPDWMQPFLSIQPFRCIIDIPCRLYTGMISSNEVIYYLGFQVLWVLIFIVLGKILIRKALKQFVVLGG